MSESNGVLTACERGINAPYFRPILILHGSMCLEQSIPTPPTKTNSTNFGCARCCSKRVNEGVYEWPDPALRMLWQPGSQDCGHDCSVLRLIGQCQSLARFQSRLQIVEISHVKRVPFMKVWHVAMGLLAIYPFMFGVRDVLRIKSSFCIFVCQQSHI